MNKNTYYKAIVIFCCIILPCFLIAQVDNLKNRLSLAEYKSTEKLEIKLGSTEERALFETTQLANAAKLKKLHLLNIILTTILLLIAALTILIYRNYRIKVELNTQLKQRNIKLNRYAYSISHDMLSKLKHIGFIGNMMIEDNQPSIEDYQKYYQRSRSIVQWLQQYCTDLLNWSEAPDTKPDAFADLGIITKDILDSYKESIQQHNIQIEIGAIKNDIPLSAEPLKQVMQNLIDNAIKFSKSQAQPMIHITSVQEGQSISIIIENNGIELPVEFQGNLMDKIKTKTGQASHGLAIVESILKQYGGILKGESSKLGGAKFTIEFFNI